MKNLYKLIVFTLFTFSCSLLTAQTNVSGGIYSNTTWTLLNSPYIVTDTVVVFPGVTLTIEPGVVVKFDDNIRLEIRQATLIAIGTITDSITFTSNSNTPYPGIWDEIYLNGTNGLNFNYCNFYFANQALSSGNTNHVRNSNFINNVYGVYWSGINADTCNFINNTYGLNIFGGYVHFCRFSNNQCGALGAPGIFNNCFFVSNQNGIIVHADVTIKNSIIDSNIYSGIVLTGASDSIYNCVIKYNGIGLNDSNNCYDTRTWENIIENNSIGVKISNASNNLLYCNKICNNSLYDLYYNVSFNSNISIPNNYWCSTDSATIHSHIYDGYTNINLGLVSVFPIDTVGCYLTGCNLQLTTIVDSNATCDTCHNGSATVYIANGFGPYTYTWNTAPVQTTQTAHNLSSGTYTVCVVDNNGCTACKSVYIDSSNCTGFIIHLHESNATCFNCTDGSAWVIDSGGTAPYNYSWYTAPFQYTQTAINLLQGTYTVCVTDAYGCVVCDSITIGTGNCSANFLLYPDTNIAHHYWAINQASGVPPLTYDWNWGDNSAHDFTANPSHTYSIQGSYTICLTITDSVGCQNEFCQSFYLLHPKDITNIPVTVNVVGSLLTGITQLSTLNSQFSIYPNPNDGNFTITQLGIRNYELGIFDIMGQEVYHQQINNSTQYTINLSNLNNGIYFYHLTNSNETKEGKFAIEK